MKKEMDGAIKQLRLHECTHFVKRSHFFNRSSRKTYYQPVVIIREKGDRSLIAIFAYKMRVCIAAQRICWINTSELTVNEGLINDMVYDNRCGWCGCYLPSYKDRRTAQNGCCLRELIEAEESLIEIKRRGQVRADLEKP